MKNRSGYRPSQCRKPMVPKRVPGRLKPYPPHRRAGEIQLVYAHFAPPVTFSATEHIAFAPWPGNAFSKAGPGSRKNAPRAHRFAGPGPEVRPASLAGAAK